MPSPNRTDGDGDGDGDAVGVIDFGRLGRRAMEGRFDGGSMTSDSGMLLLMVVDRRLGLIEAASRCTANPRNSH